MESTTGRFLVAVTRVSRRRSRVSYPSDIVISGSLHRTEQSQSTEVQVKGMNHALTHEIVVRCPYVSSLLPHGVTDVSTSRRPCTASYLSVRSEQNIRFRDKVNENVSVKNTCRHFRGRKPALSTKRPSELNPCSTLIDIDPLSRSTRKLRWR